MRRELSLDSSLIFDGARTLTPKGMTVLRRLCASAIVVAALAPVFIGLFAGTHVGALILPTRRPSLLLVVGAAPGCGQDCVGRDFSNTDLSGQNLANVNFLNANLSNANLSNANLSGSNLIGANLTGAQTSGVTWSNSTCPDGSAANTDGTWHHVVATVGPAGQRLYVDGVLAASNATASGSGFPSYFHFGGPVDANNGTTQNSARIAQAAVFPNQLSQAQISSLYNVRASSTGLSNLVNSMNPILYLPLNNGTTNSAGGSVGNGAVSGFAGGTAQPSTTLGPARSGSYLFTNSKVSSVNPYTLTNSSAYSVSFWFQADSTYQRLERVSNSQVIGQGIWTTEIAYNSGGSGLLGLWQWNANLGQSSYVQSTMSFAPSSTPSCVANLAASMNGTFVGPGADLQNVNFGTADLSNRDLSWTNISGADLSNANLTGVIASNVTSSSATQLPVGWSVNNGYLVGPGANLSNADLTGMDLSGANVSNANLSGATFSGTTLRYANVTSANFSSTSLSGLVTGGLIGTAATLPTGWTQQSGFFLGQNANLTGANLAGIDLSGLNLSGVSLRNAVLTNVNLTNVNLSNANLTNTKLSGVNLSSANLGGATVSGMTGTSLTANGQTTFPSNTFKVVGGVLVGPGVNLRNLNLSNLNLSNANLSGATLTGANVSGANLAGAVLTGVTSGSLLASPMPTLPSGWTIAGGYLFGPGATLTNLSVSPPKTTISSVALTATSTSLNVASAAVFPVSGTFSVQIDDEIINVTAGAGSTTWTISRGSSGTIAASHDIGSSVVQTTGLNLSNANLSNVNLTGANLAYANLSDANLQGANLTNANLTGTRMNSGTNLSGTVLAGATMRAGNFDGVNFSNVVLVGAVGATTVTGVNFANATLTNAALGSLNFASSNISGIRSGGTGGSPVLPSGWFLSQGYLIGPSANLSGLNLTGVSFAGITGLTGINLQNSNLTNVNFSNASLLGFNLAGTNLTGTNFTNANLSGIFSGSISATVAPSLPTGWTLTNGYLIGPGADLSRASLAGVNLSNRALNTTKFANATLTNANLSGAVLTSSVLTGANLSNANLSSAWLKNANLTSANLNGANLSNASLLGATLTSANFSNATLTNLASGSLVSTSAPTFPSGWGLLGGYILGPSADLTNANLTNANFGTFNLSSATLTGVRTGSASGSPTLPSGYRMIGGYFVGPGVNLTNANLGGQNLGSLRLNGTVLTGASLGGANLSANNLNGIVTGSLTSTPTLPSGYSVKGGYLVGPGVNLTNANLGTANLTNVNLQGSTLSGTNLSNTTLTGVVSGAVTGFPQLPSGWTISNGYLIGRGANLNGATLSGVDVNGFDLTGTNFTNAQLQGANFTNAVLTNAAMSGANLGPIPVTTTLTAAINNSQGSITVNSSSGFPSRGTFVIQVDSEKITVTAGNGTTSWTVTRGQYATSPAGHSNGSTISLQQAGANLTGATLTGTNLANATLNGVTSSGIISGAQPTLPANWTLIQGGFLIGPGSNLSRATMTGLNLSGVNFSGAILVGANLSNSNMSNSNLSNAYLTSAVVNGTNLTGANLSGLASGGLTGSPTLPSGYILANGFILGQNLDLRGAILQNQNLNGVNLSNSNLSGANLNGSTLTSSTTLTNTNLSTASLQSVNLSGANLSSVNVSGTSFFGANLSSATLGSSTTVSNSTSFANANFFGATINGLNLAVVGSSNLSGLMSGSISGTPSLPSGWWTTPGGGYLVGPGANLQSASLQSLTFSSPNFSNVDLHNASFFGSILPNANFANADMTGTNLSGANLRNADLSNASVSSVDLSYASISGIKLPSSVTQLYTTGINFCTSNYTFSASSQTWSGPCSSWNVSAQLPSNWRIFDGGASNDRSFLAGPGASLYGADLSNWNMSGVALDNVSSGFLKACPSALPANWVCRSVGTKSDFTANDGTNNDYWLIGPNVDLSSQDFTQLTNPSLRDVHASGANMAGSDFSTTDLTGIDLGNGANLTNTNINGANLTASYIHDLSSWTGLQMPGGYSIFTRAGNRSNGPANVLMGPIVSFYYMDLSNWDLTGANMPGAFFEGTNLTGANLTNANLNGANLGNATLTNANLTNTAMGMAVEGGYSRFTLNWGSTQTSNYLQAPLDTTCPPGYVIGQVSSGKNNSIPGLEALGFNCVPVTSQGSTGSSGIQHVDVLANYSMGQWWAYCPSGQAAIGLESHFDNNRVQNVGPICASFPTGSNASAVQMPLTNDGLKDGTYGKYANASFICPAGQWLVGVQAQTDNPTGAVYMLNQAICETWNQVSAGGLVSGGIVGMPKLSPGWTVANGYLVGPGVNLQNVNLSGTNLTGVNFGNANLQGTNLSNATLDYVSSNGVTGNPTLSWPFGIRNGYLLGTKVSLMGADLHGLDLSNWYMPGASIVNANLQGVNLQRATLWNTFFGHYSTSVDNLNLYGTNLSNADMSFHNYDSVNLSSANCTGSKFINTRINGGSNRGVGGSYVFNNTNFTNATIAKSTLTGNLSTVDFTGNTSYGNTFQQWLLFPSAWNYGNGTIRR